MLSATVLASKTANIVGTEYVKVPEDLTARQYAAIG